MKRKGEVTRSEKKYLASHQVCEGCGAKKNISYDHIIPKTILVAFNRDPNAEYWEENSQSLCVACNQQKAQYLDLSNPKTIFLLKELIKSKEER